MTNEDDMTIRKAAREICAAQAAQCGSEASCVAFYLSGDYDHLVGLRMVEQGIRKGIEIGRSL